MFIVFPLSSSLEMPEAFPARRRGAFVHFNPRHKCRGYGFFK